MRTTRMIAFAVGVLLLGGSPAVAGQAEQVPRSDWIKSTVAYPTPGTSSTRETIGELPRSPQEVEAEARRTQASYEVSADGMLQRKAAVKAGYDYITSSECQANDEADDPGGWVKNHFAWCKRGYDYTTYAKTCNPQNPNDCIIRGTVRVRWDVIGYGRHEDASSPSTTDRHMNFTITVRDIQPTGVFTQPGASFSLSTWCYTTDPLKNCKTDGTNGATRTIPQWRADPNAYVELISPAKEPAKQHGEQLIHAGPVVKFAGQVPGFQPGASIDAEMTDIRFDSAWYLSTYGNRGSIFTRVAPFLVYSKAANSGYKEVADHIEQALNRPGDTKPPFSDKQIPGKSWQNPIYRLASELNDDNSRREGRNRYYSKKACNVYFPGWDTLKGPDGKPINQCDEFPFASTYNGAGQFIDDGPQYKDMFSAKPVHRDDNNAAGNVLKLWYHWERITDHNPFYVTVR
ncbi:hypothetical protein AB0I77_15430 [Streptomyces sp. NPDC050619]|uniref:hypothetical protein n=1 Tax=Streptomyces sp. NPDC050619 TaxID=3157214 RepID=UPI003449BB8B